MKLEDTHCSNNRYGVFANVEDAKVECRRSSSCKAVYDNFCDNSVQDVYLCPVGYDYETSNRGSCVYEKLGL